ncbi:hypothetical protein IEQ34_012748 [Dendrobium chrysotoxum]|uniref:Uncharacterized protein n=1 Tax=Dendrobium chrysotoxum TaxID=161865 RepID=A0AAV7GP13_DENCH|nr:hypothetical protein IEQ34_012748 [Dendrobium chrysotoxum]
MKVPTKSDRACSPPPTFWMMYEFSLRAGLQFLPPLELVDILTTCGNDWNFLEKWGKPKDLLIPLLVEVEDLLKILNPPKIDTLHYEVHYLSRYVDEEYLFKVGISTQVENLNFFRFLLKWAENPDLLGNDPPTENMDRTRDNEWRR